MPLVPPTVPTVSAPALVNVTVPVSAARVLMLLAVLAKLNWPPVPSNLRLLAVIEPPAPSFAAPVALIDTVLAPAFMRPSSWKVPVLTVTLPPVFTLLWNDVLPVVVTLRLVGVVFEPTEPAKLTLPEPALMVRLAAVA